LNAGGAWLPLDPEYPRERLAFMVADARPGVILTRERLVDALPDDGAQVVCLDSARTGWQGQTTPAVARTTSRCVEVPQASGVKKFALVCPDRVTDSAAQHPAYVIYTSGSTGRPKGVVVSRRGLSNLTAAQIRLFGLRPEDRVLQFASLNFDASVAETATALAVGASLHLASPERLLPGSPLVETLRQQEITCVTLPPSALAVLEGEDLPALATLITAGEACSPELARRWSADRRFWNAYGPTETTVCATGGRYLGGPRLPIGVPIANTRVYLLDRRWQLVATGSVGELCVAGAGVARGYLDRPALTAERFLPNPLSGGPFAVGERLYRTGDLARHLPDGSIEFLGRVDDQVKIRGFRIEPGEVEVTLARHPAVAAAVVMVRADVPDLGAREKRLVGYVVAEQGAAIDRVELRDFMKERLPDYMVPAALVELGSLPLTPNGKVDRGALPAPEWGKPHQETALRTPEEEILAGIWTAVLGVERVGAHDNFFELGGHSLLATQVVSRIRETLRVELPLPKLFEAPTVAELAELVHRLRRREEGVTVPPLVPVARDRDLPLSFAQQRLWFLDQLEPASPVYNIPSVVDLGGAVLPELLERAFNEVVRRHEALRTTFAAEAGRPRQVIAEHLDLPLPVVDLQPLAAPEREAEARRLAAAEALRPFDLTRGPLVRVTLLRLAAEHEVVLVTMHHIVSDGWSVGMLMRELTVLYQAFSEDPEARRTGLADLPVQYADYAHWQRRWLKGEALERQLGYWKRQLAGAPQLLELPTDRPRPVHQSFRGSLLPLTLDEELAAALTALSRRQQATLFMTLLAAFATLLGRTSGRQDVVVGSPIAGRNRQELEALIGLFVNTLVLRTELAGDPSFRRLLAAVRHTALDAYAHQDLPFERLVEKLHPQRDAGSNPLFQVMFVLQNLSWRRRELPEVTFSPLPLSGVTAKFDLTLLLEERGATIAGVIEYSTDLFDDATMQRLAAHFQGLLRGIIADPGRRLSQLPLLTPAERHQLLREWNDTAALWARWELNAAATVGELFTVQAESTPAAVAMICGRSGAPDRALSYGELNARANRVAHQLKALGVGPEVPVGIAAERGPEVVVGLLGILKAGGVSLPLDPALPADRLSFMLADAGAPVVLVQQAVAGSLPPAAGVQLVYLDGPSAESPAAAGSEDPESFPDPENLAYVIYTSGTTGVPKGVAVSHRQVLPILCWSLRHYPIDGHSRVVQTLSYCFDMGWFELMSTLAGGGRLCFLPPAEQTSLDGYLDVIARHAINTVHTTPSFFRALAGQGRSLSGLETVHLGGEPLSPELVREIAAVVSPRCRIHNGYGPTEAAINSAIFPLRDLGTTTVPIGRVTARNLLYVVDRYSRPQPAGVPGELRIGGRGPARGYLRRPALTAERFVPDPFSVAAGGRLYRSGDLARYRTDGTLEFLGRIDHQVKLRGFRIELGEIEAVLGEHPEVQQAVVLAREDVPGDKRLVAYVVAEAEAELDRGRLRAWLTAKLPEYMVPWAFVLLEALPATPNGKADRAALPAPETTGRRRYVAPRDPPELALAQLWQELLGIERVGVRDDFFALGGHSLLAVRLMAAIRARTGHDLPLEVLFRGPTIERLAALLRRQDGVRPSPLVEIQGGGVRLPLF
ncbi:MAG: amino acid adenylation domain-containing protein, partial [bacterium]|nr:amino acid adenylation domain-containing protein [bacterium]